MAAWAVARTSTMPPCCRYGLLFLELFLEKLSFRVTCARAHTHRDTYIHIYILHFRFGLRLVLTWGRSWSQLVAASTTALYYYNSLLLPTTLWTTTLPPSCVGAGTVFGDAAERKLLDTATAGAPPSVVRCAGGEGEGAPPPPVSASILSMPSSHAS